MLHRQHNGVQWLEFELLADCPIVHGCFKRHGGESSGALSSLNLGRSVGDNPDNVRVNWGKVSEALTLPHMLSARLCHGDLVTALTTVNGEVPMSDGVSTQIPNMGLMITQADCQAAIFYDPVKHVLSNVHCGGR